MSSIKKTAKKTPIWALILVFVLLVAAIGAVTVHILNDWRIEFSIPQKSEQTVECLSEYEEPKVTAVLKGNIFYKDGKEIEVKETGRVETDKLGEYKIGYSASAMGVSADCERTVAVVDTTAPVITLIPDDREYILPGTQYDDPGFSASDNVDGDLTAKVETTNDGETVTYTVADSSGNVTTVTRTIPYGDPIPPEITLLGSRSVELTIGRTSYKEPGFTATDNVDGDITDRVVITGEVNSYAVGTYTLTYTVEDSYHNVTSVTRTVNVNKHVRQPDISSTDPLPEKVIYLTFDDGPGTYTEELLDVLKEYNVKATFFVVKTGRVKLIEREAKEGHSVGIHSVSHVYKEIYASEEAYFKDLWEMNEIIKKYTGEYSYILRFPGGSSNTVSRFNPGIMTRLTKAVEDAGFAYFDWNVSSGDAGETKDTDQVYKNVINGVKNKKVAVVLQHDIKPYSIKAVERIIIWGLENGYTFLPLTPDSPVCHSKVRN